MRIGGVGLRLEGEDEKLCVVAFEEKEEDSEPQLEVLRRTIAELEKYFQGERREFSAELAPAGTPFQLRVWRELSNIPYGETRSYREIAEKIGSPKAVRAVGAANGANPIGIIIPCHRVIGNDGSLTGYGGGLDLKRRLLELEGALPRDREEPQPSLFADPE